MALLLGPISALCSAGAPANDNFLESTELAGTMISVRGNNAGGSREPAEPNNPSGPSQGASIWWKWTASRGGTVTIDTIGSDFDAFPTAFGGSFVSALTSVATADETDARRIVFNANPGVTYHIAVDGRNGGTGNVVLNLRMAYAFTTFAGQSSFGSADGSGASARFLNPEGVAVDGAGNIYVADTYNSTIRKIGPGGAVSTLAGAPGSKGGADGLGGAARFNMPYHLTVDAGGNIYVADTYNHTIRKITPAGLVSTLGGLADNPGSVDGPGSIARFYYPCGIAIDAAGNLYIGDQGNGTIRKISPAGVASSLAGSAGFFGSQDAIGSAARFSNLLYNVAVDSAGTVYVADAGNHTIRKISPAGVVSTLAGLAGSAGNSDGNGTAARFRSPLGVAVGQEGNVFVGDQFNDTIRKITPAGDVTTFAGSAGIVGSADGPGAIARFANIGAVAVDGSGNVYVADEGNKTIRKISPAGLVSTIAGLPNTGLSADGVGREARFCGPTDVAIDQSKNLYVAEPSNHVIRKITPTGTVSTLAGLAGASGTTDGLGPAARFNSPNGVTVDRAGNVFVADTDNSVVRKITPDGNVSTVAGMPAGVGSADGLGAAARFNTPYRIAADSADNFFIADTFNHTIRRMTPEGAVVTFAGLAGAAGSADGSRIAARFQFPQGVSADRFGNVYVADRINQLIRAIAPDGSVTTLAGQANLTGSTDGLGNARFNLPSGVGVDANNSVLVADSSNNTLRVLLANGSVSTLAGLPGPGTALGSPGNADGTGVGARFRAPTGLALDDSGNLFVADSGNNTIRKGVPTYLYTIGAGRELRQEQAAAGSNICFQITATGSPSPVFQWRRDGANLPGATTATLIPGGGVVSTLVLVNAQDVDSGTYDVLVLGPNSTSVSPAIVLAIKSPPAVTRHPAPQSGAIGSTISLEATAIGPSPLTYQWQKDGVPIPGASSATYAIASAQAADTGVYTCLVSNPVGSIATQPALVSIGARLVNVSVRTILDDRQILIVGFTVIDGRKEILVRAAGPALESLGVTGVLSDPKIELYRGPIKIGENDNWPATLAPVFARQGAFPFPAGSKDAAILDTLAGGYSAQVSGPGRGTILVEAYDAGTNPTAHLTNLSARNVVKIDGDPLIAGFYVAGTGSKRVVIRAIGPGLAPLGVTGFLLDPKLEVFAANGAKIGENDNWDPALAPIFASVGAFALPVGSKDAATIITLAAENGYTVQVKGANGGAGDALIELYELP